MKMRLPLLAVFLVLQGGAALACSCIRISLDEAVARAPVVFEGRVLATRTNAAEQRLVARVAATRWMKGRARPTVFVETTTAPAMCGYPLVQGRVYTFGAGYDKRGRLVTDMCAMVPLNPSRRP